MNAVDDLRLASGYYYLATPYSKWAAGLDDAAQTAAWLAGRLIVAGVVVYSPIAHSHAIARAAGIDPYDHAVWLPADRPLFDAAHGLLVAALEGWRDSYGICEEITWAKSQRKPRFLLDPRALTWQALP